MASVEFAADAEEKRPTVQVGDPFTEKLLIEACLELMATDAIVAIQDMGAAGLTSSSVEMAAKGGVGIELDLDQVPARETGMTAYEFMLSESQERMLMVLRPDREDVARTIFEKWELDFAVIGHLTDTGRITVRHHGQVEADIPLAPLNDQAPLYHRPTAETRKQPQINPAKVEDRVGLTAALWKLIACPDLASRAWVWDQYDSTVGGQTVKRPGAADAAVVKLEGLSRALALTTDCTPRYCAADPEAGGAQAVAEAWRNLTAVGARPLALTDNMNFGNPERPEIMGQFAAAIRGMAAACEALDFPVVSGNVSLYNETRDPSGIVRAILPTPAIGGLGVLDDAAKAVGIAIGPWLDIVLVGTTKGWLGQSLWLREIAGREEGAPPPVDLAAERATGDFVRAQILAGHVRACHDVSDGGLLVAVAEMAMAGMTGVRLSTSPRDIPSHAYWYGEDQARYVLAVPDAGSLIRAAEAAGLAAVRIGTSGGQDLTLPDGGTISVRALRAAHERFFPSWMDGD
jgi:phosphoribosylformylglycinamidine synthase